MRQVKRHLIKGSLVAGAFLLILGSQACAPANPNADTTNPDAPILRSELESRPYHNLHDAIRSLRPIWVSSRLGGVRYNNAPMGIEWLRNTSVELAERIERVPHEKAVIKWSTRWLGVSKHIVHVIGRRTR